MKHHLGDAATAFVDGELSGAERDRVVAHLADCPLCQAEIAELRSVKEHIAHGTTAPVVPAPVLCQLRERARQRALGELVGTAVRMVSHRGQMKMPIVVGSAMLVAAALIGLGSEAMEGPDRPPAAAAVALSGTAGVSANFENWLARLTTAPLHVRLAQAVVYRHP